MNSIDYRFKGLEKLHPQRCAFGLLKEAVEGRMYKHRTIREGFLRLVPKDDYEPSVEKDLIEELYRASNTPMDNHFEGVNSNLSLLDFDYRYKTHIRRN